MVTDAYRFAVDFPREESHGLTNRADTLQTQLQIALNLNYISTSDFESCFEASREIERVLSNLISKIK